MPHIFLNTQRKAIAMIELIFAIVVMGIVLLSIPNLISISTSSGFVSLQQEAIATSASHINLIMTKHWDENNTIDGPILETNSTIAGLPTAQRGGRVMRAIVNPAASTLFATPPTKLGPDTNDTFDDMDDAHGSTMTLRDFNATSISSGDMLDTNITINTSVVYVSDALSAPQTYNGSSTITFNITSATMPTTTNIKYITTRLTTNNAATELQKNISLNAFSCNIGTYEPAEKDLP
jgi:hypothetical protein